MPPTSPEPGRRQPRLSALTTIVNAPGCVVSQADGNIGATGIEGYYLDDRRILSRVHLGFGAGDSEHLATASSRPQEVEFTATLQIVTSADWDFGLEGDAPIRIVRRRMLDTTGLTEQIVVTSTAPHPATVTLALRLGSDGAGMSEARAGERPALIPPTIAGGDTAEWTFSDAVTNAQFSPLPSSLALDEDSCAVASWQLTLAPGKSATASARVITSGMVAQQSSAETPAVTLTGDHDLSRLFSRSLADAFALVREDVVPDQRYICAGAPWYLTLFGRDSIWSARMLLPIDRSLALGTLRALASRQGTDEVPETAEAPGKILHELRRDAAGSLLPPRYFGTADATSLWIILLVEGWRWGIDQADVRSLLPNLRAALGWLRSTAAASAAGFIEYTPDPVGLSNQGWKDSRDAIHDAAGDHRPGPVALVEAQGYAYQAAVGAADLLEAFGEGGAEEWRDWAAALKDRFRARFWSQDDEGRYPAVALIDGEFVADAVTSNMGHLLATGILDEDEVCTVAARLGHDGLNSGFGLRTLSSSSPRYNPISYHNGSVWPHDTAIVISGLAASGHGATAASLADGIIAAGQPFDFRLPELWCGSSTIGGPSGTAVRPVPYPTACSPQAWSAASVVAVVVASLGLTVDVPAGRITIRPPKPLLVGPFTLRGLSTPAGSLDVTLHDDGTVTVLRAPDGFLIST